MQAKAAMLRLRVAEVPVHYRKRTAGQSNMMGVEKEWDLYCDRPYVYTENRLDLRHAKVLQISLDRDELLIEGQSPQPFDKLLLALGAQPRKLNIAGDHLSGVHNFTLMSDVKAMMEKARRGMRSVVIGGGLLGAELSEVWRT